MLSHHICIYNQQKHTVSSLNEQMKAYLFHSKEMGDYLRVSKSSKYGLYDPIDPSRPLKEGETEPKTPTTNTEEDEEDPFFKTEFNILRKGVSDLSIFVNSQKMFVPIFLISKPIILSSEERLKKIQEETSIIKEFEMNESGFDLTSPIRNLSFNSSGPGDSSMDEQNTDPTELDLGDENLELVIENNVEVGVGVVDANKEEEVVVTIGNVAPTQVQYNVNFDTIFYSEENMRIRQQLDK